MRLHYSLQVLFLDSVGFKVRLETLRHNYAAIGLLISRYAFYAAVLLAVVMAGAIIAHVTVLGSSPAAPVLLLVLTGIIAYLRKP